MKKSIAGLIVLVVLLGAMLTTIIVNRKYIFTKDKIYTQKEVDSMSAKISEEARIKYADDTLLDRIDSLSVQRIKLLAEVEQLKTEQEQHLNSITDYEKNVSDLNNQIKLCEAEKQNLSSQIESNNQTISDLNLQKSNLESQVINLQNENNIKNEQITSLNNQINVLQQNVRQLQTTNQINSETITRLNNQIADLSNQVVELTLFVQNSSSIVNNLNSRINELEKSVAYYESYIAQLENGEQVVATFEFDGSVYNIQIVNKGSKLSVTTPTSTDYKIFNGWTVNGSAIDLSTYTIDNNTKFVADITYKFDVKFKVEDEVIDSQLIEKDSYAIPPTDPTKESCEFIGWSINGIDVVSNIDTIGVTQNTTYVALFKKIYNVTFMVDDTVYNSQSVKENGYASVPTNPTKTGYIFKGWSVNENDIIYVGNYKILQNETFIALFTYDYNGKYDVDIDASGSALSNLNGTLSFDVIEGQALNLNFTPTNLSHEVSDYSSNVVSSNDVECSFDIIFSMKGKNKQNLPATVKFIIRFKLSEEDSTILSIKGNNVPCTLNSFEITRS